MIKSDEKNGSYTLLPTVSTDVNLIVRGGHAVFLQGNLHDVVANTEASRQQPYTLLAAVPATYEDTLATGKVIPHLLAIVYYSK